MASHKPKVKPSGVRQNEVSLQEIAAQYDMGNGDGLARGAHGVDLLVGMPGGVMGEVHVDGSGEERCAMRHVPGHAPSDMGRAMKGPQGADVRRVAYAHARRFVLSALLVFAIAVTGCRSGKTDDRTTVAAAEALPASESSQKQDAEARARPDAKGTSPAAAATSGESADDPRVQCPPGTTQRRVTDDIVGILTVKCLDADGLLHGPLRAWWPNGSPKRELHYVRGDLDGVARSWFEEGGLSSEGGYRNGKVDGKVTHYHANGKIAHAGEFREGRLVGKARAFDEKGRPIPVKDPRRIFPFLYDFKVGE